MLWVNGLRGKLYDLPARVREWADQPHNTELFLRQSSHTNEIPRLYICHQRVQCIALLQKKIRQHPVYGLVRDQLIMRTGQTQKRFTRSRNNRQRYPTDRIQILTTF